MITGLVNLQLVKKYRERNLNSYLAAVIDKEELLKNTPSPKIIIIGGSNAAFGFDSGLISRKTGIPVVNTGLQGGLGIRFAINYVKPYIHEGDIVLLSPEYHNIFATLKGGEILAETLIVYPRGIRYISSFNEVWEILKALPAVHTSAIELYFEKHLRHKCYACVNEKIYYRTAFDPLNGDITTNNDYSYLSKTQILTLMYKMPNPELSSNIKFFNDFNDYVLSKKAKAYFFYPSTVKPEDVSTIKLLNSLAEYLPKHLTMPMPESLVDTQYPDELMFDTAYHLNDMGRVYRSNRVVDALCKAEPGLDCK